MPKKKAISQRLYDKRVRERDEAWAEVTRINGRVRELTNRNDGLKRDTATTKGERDEARLALSGAYKDSWDIDHKVDTLGSTVTKLEGQLLIAETEAKTLREVINGKA